MLSYYSVLGIGSLRSFCVAVSIVAGSLTCTRLFPFYIIVLEILSNHLLVMMRSSSFRSFLASAFLPLLVLCYYARPSLAIERYRTAVLDLIRDHHAGHTDPKVRAKVAKIIQEYAGSDEADPSDVLFAIGSSIFGASMPEIEKQHPVHDDDPPFTVVGFDYMKEFIRDVFVGYGVTPERAEICADVLIESDKRGIDSHGLGRGRIDILKGTRSAGSETIRFNDRSRTFTRIRSPFFEISGASSSVYRIKTTPRRRASF